jgi:hypothetical protein
MMNLESINGGRDAYFAEWRRQLGRVRDQSTSQPPLRVLACVRPHLKHIQLNNKNAFIILLSAEVSSGEGPSHGTENGFSSGLGCPYKVNILHEIPGMHPPI